jgi:hypothetical protein
LGVFEQTLFPRSIKKTWLAPKRYKRRRVKVLDSLHALAALMSTRKSHRVEHQFFTGLFNKLVFKILRLVYDDNFLGVLCKRWAPSSLMIKLHSRRHRSYIHDDRMIAIFIPACRTIFSSGR